MTLVITGFLYIFTTANVHPFHVSVCEIYHNEKTQSLEISLKIFIDDFELSIQKRGDSDFILTESNPDHIDSIPIENYLKDHFTIKLNGKVLKLHFLGFEFNNDAILCYLEAEKVKKINQIELRNSIITEVYDDQINLTHFQLKGEMKSVKTNKDNLIASIDLTNL